MFGFDRSDSDSAAAVGRKRVGTRNARLLTLATCCIIAALQSSYAAGQSKGRKNSNRRKLLAELQFMSRPRPSRATGRVMGRVMGLGRVAVLRDIR